MSRPSNQAYRVKRTERLTGDARFACPFSTVKATGHKTTRACYGKGFESISRLKEHISRCHPEKQLHQCLSCFRCFPSKNTLQQHRGEPHEGSRRNRMSASNDASNSEDAVIAQYQAIKFYLLPDSDPATSPFVLTPDTLRDLVNRPSPKLKEKVSHMVQMEYALKYELNETQQAAFGTMFWDLLPKFFDLCQVPPAAPDEGDSIATLSSAETTPPSSQNTTTHTQSEFTLDEHEGVFVTAVDDPQTAPTSFIDPRVLSFL